MSDQMLLVPLAMLGSSYVQPFRYFNSSPEVIRLW